VLRARWMPKINTWMAMGRWSSLALGVSSDDRHLY